MGKTVQGAHKTECELRMIVRACNLNTWETRAGGSCLEANLEWHSDTLSQGKPKTLEYQRLYVHILLNRLLYSIKICFHIFQILEHISV